MNMLCQRCQSRPAAVHSISINNGVKHEEHLCQECAAQMGHLKLTPDLNFHKIFPSFFTELNPHPAKTEKQCPNCHTGHDELRHTGKPGCPQCYLSFENDFKLLFSRIHGENLHRGKLPLSLKEKPNTAEALKSMLIHLVQEENYEEAAKVRDQIRLLEEEKAGEGLE